MVSVTMYRFHPFVFFLRQIHIFRCYILSLRLELYQTVIPRLLFYKNMAENHVAIFSICTRISTLTVISVFIVYLSSLYQLSYFYYIIFFCHLQAIGTVS